MTAPIKPIYTGTVTGFFTFLFQLCECDPFAMFGPLLPNYMTLTFANIDLNHVLNDLAMQWAPTFATRFC